MATRIYLPSSGTAPLGSLAVDSQWELSGSLVRLPCNVSKSNTSLTQKYGQWESTTTQQWVWAQFQSPQMNAGYSWTTSETVSMVIKVAEAVAQVDSHLCYVIRVVSGDGATIRGTVGAYLATSTEYPTSLGAIATRIHDARTDGASNFSSLTGDRLIIEIGHHGVSPALNLAYHNYGDPVGTDDYPLTAGETTDLCPWVEFSGTLPFPILYSLTVQGATQSQAANNVALTAQGPSFTLVVQGTIQLQNADNTIITYHEPVFQVITNNTEHIQNSDNVVLTQHYIITSQSTTQAQTSDNIILIQYYSLIIQDPSQIQTTRYNDSWWLEGDINPTNVKAAYQAENVASYADSKINLANPGTYNLTESGVPSWTSNGGWHFDGTTSLRTGITPPANENVNWTLICRFDNTEGSSSFGLMFGINNGAGQCLGITSYDPVIDRHSYFNGTGPSRVGARITTLGTMAVAGGNQYLDGNSDGNFTPVATSFSGYAIFLGKGDYDTWIGDILSCATYDIILTANQVAKITDAMNGDVVLMHHQVLIINDAVQLQIVTENYKDKVINTAPIAYWALDEISGTSAINSGTLGTDANGSYAEINTLGAINAPGGTLAPYFDGSSDGVDIFTTSLRDNFNPAEMTISIWGKAGDANLWSDNEYFTLYIIGKDSLNNYFGLCRIGPITGRLDFDTHVNEGSIGQSITGLSTLEWVNYTITRSETTQIQKYYKDGIEITPSDADTRTWGAITLLDNVCYLGCSISRSNSWRGYISHAGVWNRALTPDEILSLYNTGIGNITLGSGGTVPIKMLHYRRLRSK